jgi:hypothetical protein
MNGHMLWYYSEVNDVVYEVYSSIKELQVHVHSSQQSGTDRQEVEVACGKQPPPLAAHVRDSSRRLESLQQTYDPTQSLLTAFTTCLAFEACAPVTTATLFIRAPPRLLLRDE